MARTIYSDPSHKLGVIGDHETFFQMMVITRKTLVELGQRPPLDLYTTQAQADP